MTKRSENRKIRAAERKWDRIARPVNRTIDKMTKEIKYNLTNWLDWYFGDMNEKDKIMKYLRRFGVLCVDIIILKLLNLI